MAYKAHARLVAVERRRVGLDDDGLAAATEDTYREAVEPWLEAARSIGNTYTASLYFCLATLAERERARLAGRTVGLFSYGSGCCAEYFTGRFAPGAGDVASTLGLANMLAARRALSVAEYESYSQASAGTLPSAEAPPAIRFLGITDHKRRYADAEVPA
jgi:hydroxymethylglutaryl-CoA synthase